MTTPTPKAKSHKTRGRLKRTSVIQLEDCPKIDNCEPLQATVIEYPDVPKAGVEVYYMQGKMFPRTARYNLMGYSSRELAPVWLVTLLKETGAYEGPVEL